MARGVLILVRATRTARARLRRAVRRDLLPRTTQRLRNARAAGQVEAVVARCTRSASVRRACRARCHVAVGARRALLELALAVARRGLTHRLVLSVVAHRVCRARSAAVVRQRRCYLHVLRAGAHVYVRALAVDRRRRCSRLARCAQCARCPCVAARDAMPGGGLIRAGGARAARAL